MTNTRPRRSLGLWVAVIALAWTTLVGASLAWSLAHDRYVVDVLADTAVRSNDPRDAKYRNPDVVGGPLERTELAAHGGAWGLGLLTLGAAALLLQKRQREQTLAGTTLRQSEERFRTLVEQAGDGFELVDATGRLVDVNEATCRQLGYTRDELLGLSIPDIDPDVTSEVYAEGFGRMLGQPAITFGARHRRKDGTVFPVEVTTSAIRAADQYYLLSLVRDVSERNRIQAELDAGRRELDRFFGLVPDLVCVSSPNGYFKKLGGSWEHTLGFTQAELLAQPFETFVHPDDVEPTRQEVLRQRGGGTTVNFVNRYRTKAGDYRWLEWVASSGVDDSMTYAAARDITDRKQVEAALRKSETELREAQRVARVGSWERDLKTGSIAWSEELYRLYGLDPTLPVPGFEALAQFYTPESWTRLNAAVEKTVRTGAPFDVEVQIVRTDGNLIHAMTRGEAVLDATERVVGTRGTVLDVTQRKRAEEDLSLSQQRLALHIKQTPLAVIEFDLEGRVQEWNPAAVRMLGYSREEAIGQHWTFIVPRTTWDSLDGVWESIVTFRGGGRSTNENRAKDGRTISCEWFNTPLIDPSGTTIGVASLVMDITDRKRAERQVERLTGHLASVIDSMPAMLIGIDRDGRVTQWNRRAETDTGISARDALLKPVVEILPAFAVSIARLLVGLPTLAPVSEQDVAVHRNGERRLFDVMLYPLSNDGTREAVVRIEDVTERSRVQEFMIQTEKMLSIGGLAAGIAHEINNPLGIITQAVQNVERRTSLDQPVNRDAAVRAGTSLEAVRAYHENRDIPVFLRDIREAAARAAHIISNMLEFSRTSEAVRAPADLSELLEQSLLLAASDLAMRNRDPLRAIDIVREYEPGLPKVPVERIEIEQVFLNLVTNAAHALSENPPTRPPRIVLRLARDEKYLLVQIGDNGPGMTPEVARRVFEPFFTTKPPGVGTGLGLSVAYAIVAQNHKGLIEVESSPGHGACFTIRLPLASGD